MAISPELVYNPSKRLAMVNFLGGRCAECGETESLHIHHINRRRSDNLVGNLKLLCLECHKKKHRSKVLSGEALKEVNRAFKRLEKRMERDPKFRLEIQRRAKEFNTQTKLETFKLD